MSKLSTSLPWNMVAQGYSETTMHFFRVYIEAALDRMPLSKDHLIADIACGPGTLALAAAERVREVRALDFSERMLAVLRQKQAELGVRNIVAVQGDGQNLPYDDGVFDAAFSMFGLMFFPDRARGFAELHRTVKPGGHVCVASWAAVDRSPVMNTIYKAMQEVDPNIPDPVMDATSLENPDVLQAELSEAGFEDVVIHEVEEFTELQSAKAFWEAMEKGSAPIVMMKSNMPEADWTERSARAIEHMAQAAGPFPVSLSATAYMGIARRPGD